MEEMAAFLRRASDRCRFTREYFQERGVPTSRQGVRVFHFFGDTRSEFILASLLLKRYKEELVASRYLILCSWPGHRALYPYADEYWAPEPGTVDRLGTGVLGFGNGSEAFVVQQKNLNWFFDDVGTFEDLRPYYDRGISKEFLDRLGVVKLTLPTVPSAGVLEPRVVRELATRPGWKVVVTPVRSIRGFRDRRPYAIATTRDFWAGLCRRLLDSGCTPVLVGGDLRHDLSPVVAEAIHVRPDMSQTLGLMRASAAVLDVFDGSGRLAIAARAPALIVDDRSRYVAEREYEVDALAGNKFMRQYIFSFSTIIESGDPSAWSSIYDCVAARLATFLPSIDRDGLPPTSEQTVEVPYSVVREHKARRVGARMVRVPRD